MKIYKWTITGLILAVLVLLAHLTFKLDLFESICLSLAGMDEFEIDEILIAVLIALCFSILDLISIKKDKKVKEARESIYKAMVQASDHILKNCLNQMLIIKYAAEETPDFNPEVLKSFDAIVDQAVAQLEALGEIENVDEDAIGKSINIKIFE